MNGKDFDKIAFDFNTSQNRLIILNYEGCLVPADTYPSVTSPNLRVNFLLNKLADDCRNAVLVISNFDKETLPGILSNEKLILVAEGGTHYREPGGSWNKISNGLHDWMPEALSALRALSFEYEGSYVSKDKNSISWDYRAIACSITEEELVHISDAIRNLHGSNYFKISNENSIIELRATGITRSLLLADALLTSEYDFIMAMGDGNAKENIFSGLIGEPYSIDVVESGAASGNFTIESQNEVLPFLKKLIEVNRAYDQAMPFFNLSLYKLN